MLAITVSTGDWGNYLQRYFPILHAPGFIVNHLVEGKIILVAVAISAILVDLHKHYVAKCFAELLIIHFGSLDLPINLLLIIGQKDVVIAVFFELESALLNVSAMQESAP